MLVGYLKRLFARLTVDTRLIALIVIPVLGNISSEFKGKGMQTLPYISEVCNGEQTENFVEGGGFLKTNLVLGGYRPALQSVIRGLGISKQANSHTLWTAP